MAIEYKSVISDKDWSKYLRNYKDEIWFLRTHLPSCLSWQDNTDISQTNTTRDLYTRFAHRSLMVDLVDVVKLDRLSITSVMLHINRSYIDFGLSIRLEYCYTIKWSDGSLQSFNYAMTKEYADMVLAQRKIKTPKVKPLKIGKYDIELCDDLPLVVGYDDIELVG